jgi:RHS repeat-associated protein
VYLNRFYALKNGDLGSKHIFAGETRVCTKVEKDGGSIQSGVPGSGAFVVSQGLRNALQQGNPRAPKKGINRRLPGVAGSVAASPPIEKFEFFYHGDHLGSSNFITDDAGQVYQELEYFPYGETWVEDGGSGQMPYYRFTGKELDPETGLYYYGARYYDPVLSRWISADPFLGKYLPTGSKNNYGNLAGFGGVFNPVNINLYTYTHNNPVKFVDPDGNDVYLVIWSTHDGRIGHAGIAVTQYARDSKGNMVPTGNLRYRDLWPGQPVGRNNVSQDVPAAYGDRMVKETEIQTADVSGSEGYAPEGVIRLTTDFETDANVEGALTSFSESNSSYNGLQCNCSDFAETGVEAAIGRAVGSEETIGGQKVTTPNQLFKSTRNLPNATVLKNPGSKVDQSFLRGVTGSKMGEKAGEKKMEHMRNDTRTSE